MRRATGSERPTNGRHHTLIVLLVLVCALSLSFSACGSNDTEQSTDSAETSETVAPEPAEEARLSLLVTADGWETSDGTVTVNVTGTPEDGDEVSATITIVPDMDLELSYGPGTYTFATDAITKGEIVYEAAETSVDFDGSDDQTVTLNIPKDTAATEALAQQKAEEERARAEAEAAAARAEAEAQAQAEAEAQAQAEAERQKAQETTTSQTNERTVYITKTGEKYHESWCSSLRKSKIPISLSEAEALGYEPCKNCH